MRGQHVGWKKSNRTLRIRASIPGWLRALALTTWFASVAQAVALEPSAPHASEAIAPLSLRILEAVKSKTVYVIADDATGSGAFIGYAGDKALVLTNAHVVTDERGAVCRSPKLVFDASSGFGQALAATILKVDSTADLALLSVALPGRRSALAFRNPAPLTEGTPLYVFGFPFGSSLAVEDQLPAVNVNAGHSGGRLSRTDKDFAPLFVGINPGNSGGPVVDASGRLVGIAVAHFRGTESSFMVSLNTVRGFVTAAVPGAEVAWDATETEVAGSIPKPPPTARLEGAAVRVSADGVLGGGFVIGSRRGETLVITDASTVETERGVRRSQILVTLGVGGPKARTVSAVILKGVVQEDLALLSLKDPGVSTPVEVHSAVQLYETLPVWVAGFDEDNGGALRLDRGNISGRRNGRGNETRLLQLDVGINSRTSGGPVMNAQGQVVGMAIARFKGNNVSVVIPGERVRDVLDGALRGGVVKYQHDGWDRCLLDLRAELDDPLENVTEVGLLVKPQAVKIFTTDTSRTVMELGWTLARARPHDSAVQLSAVVQPCNEGTLSYQVWVAHGDRPRQVSRSFELTVPTSDSGIHQDFFRGTYQSGDQPLQLAEHLDQPISKPRGWSLACAPNQPVLCEAQCRRGELASCRQMAFSLLKRASSVPPDRGRAIALLKQACGGGDEPACEALFPVRLEERGIAPESGQALSAYRAECQESDSAGCLWLERALLHHPAGSRGARERLALIDERCERGDPRSCALRGLVAGDPHASPQEQGLGADHYFRRACFERVLSACHNVGATSLRTEGRSVSEAFRLLRLGCDGGVGASCNDLVIAEKLAGPEAQRLLQRACALGQASSCDALRGGVSPSAVGPHVELQSFELSPLLAPPAAALSAKAPPTTGLDIQWSTTGDPAQGDVQNALAHVLPAVTHCAQARLSREPTQPKSSGPSKRAFTVHVPINGNRLGAAKVDGDARISPLVSRCLSVYFFGRYVSGNPSQHGEVILRGSL